jgi:hypothetical protein
MTTKAAPGYEIRVGAHLDAHWGAWFEGWTITNLENGQALLRRSPVDQAGLLGALSKIRDLNLTLISVVQVGEGPAGATT